MSNGKNEPNAEQLDAYGDDEVVNDRVRSELGRELKAEHLARLNINTQANGVVYLRGPVESNEQSRRIERIARATDGVKTVVNELNIG